MIDELVRKIADLEKQLNILRSMEYGSGAEGAMVCQGRLTLTSGTAFTTANVFAATTIYYTPFRGNGIALYTGGIWIYYTFTEKSLSLSGFTAGKNSDLFIYDNSGTLTLERVEWTDDTTRATALTTQDGILVKSGDSSRRYLGTFRTTGTTGQCEDSTSNRYVWNYYNRGRKTMSIGNVSSHTYDSTWRAFNNDLANSSVNFVTGIAESFVDCTVNASLTFVAGGSGAQVGPGLDTTASPLQIATFAIAGTMRQDWITARSLVSIGKHYVAILEQGTNSGADPTFNNATVSASVDC